tara:strand:+ start:29 stop:1003 length:975 start_codon:yes stop_codon:yes gene_type:complete
MATGWGQKTWGASEWGDLSDEIVSVSGISLTSSIGSESVTANADVSVSGISLSSSQGTTVAGTSVLIEDPGPVTMSSGIGSTVVGIGVPVTGSVFNTQIGAATVDESILTGEGWGRGAWGSFAWGVNYSVAVTGQSLTSSIGEEVGITDVTVAVTGSQITSTQGSFSLKIDQEIIVVASEHTINSSIGSETVTADANLTVSSAGSLTGSIGNTVAGLKTPVDVTGIQMSMTLGTFSLVQTTTESVTGLQGTLSLGQHDEIPGQIIGVSGLQATSSIGSVTVEATAGIDVTGIELTASIGSPNITAWAEIDLGVNNTWTPVDLAA